MKAEDFTSLYVSCCDFVRLHGWCDQSEEKISSLYRRLQEQPEGAAGFEGVILESFVRLGSREERLMALALLHRLSVPAGRLADLTLLNLENQINEKDGAFILHHYFGDVLPVPAALVYDVTKGNFISYKRALYRALQVSQFESPFEPEQVLLFLVQLLCRDSLNEQNRAIVYLLISRIDIDLPEHVGRIVLAAMARLHNLVDEVERRHEAVLADEIGPEESALGNPPPELTAHGAVGQPRAAASGISPGEPSSPGVLEVSPPGVPRVAPRSETAARPRPSELEGFSPASRPRAPAPVAAEAPARDGWVPAATPGEAEGLSEKAAQGPVQDLGPAVEPGRWAQAVREAASVQAPGPAVPGGPAEGPPSASGPSGFVIRFNRESRELEALMEHVALPVGESEALQAPGAPAPVARVGREPRVGAQTVPAAAEVAGTANGPEVPPRVARPRWPLIVLAAVLMVAGAVWLGWGVLSSRTTAASVALPAPTTQSVPAKPSPRGPTSAPTWSPRPGESLWSLYQSLRNASSSSSRLAGLPWGDFVRALQAANPEITVPSLIFTSQAIRLPARP